jgi:hypothetical protein
MLEDQRLFSQTAEKLHCTDFIFAMLADPSSVEWLPARRMHLLQGLH